LVSERLIIVLGFLVMIEELTGCYIRLTGCDIKLTCCVISDRLWYRFDLLCIRVTNCSIRLMVVSE
jgi:hypothetical protein